MDNSNYSVHNVSEDLIDQLLDRCMDSVGMCKCSRCRADVFAYALNRYPPHYVVSEVGDALVRVEATTNQAEVDLLTAIMSGVTLVQKRPNHN